MTLEGWVYPTARAAAGGRWRSRRPRGDLAWALYPFGDGGLPSGHAATERRPVGARHGRAGAEHVDALRRHLRRRDDPHCTSTASRSARRAQTGALLHEHAAAALRRQRGLARVVRGPPRRDPRLRPRADRARRSRPTWPRRSARRHSCGRPGRRARRGPSRRPSAARAPRSSATAAASPTTASGSG